MTRFEPSIDRKRHMIVKSIALKAGRSPGGSSQTVPIGAITVFVGPNNSGKSTVLTEIEQYVQNPTSKQNFFVLNLVNFNGIDDFNSAKAEFERIKSASLQNVPVPPGFSIIQNSRGHIQVNDDSMIAAIQFPSTNFDLYLIWLCSCVLTLGGANRNTLTIDQASGDLQSPSGIQHSPIIIGPPLRNKTPQQQLICTNPKNP